MQAVSQAYSTCRGDEADEQRRWLQDKRGVRRRRRPYVRLAFYEPSDLSRLWASSQMCPPGSVKLAVRKPHGRFTGPLSSLTP